MRLLARPCSSHDPSHPTYRTYITLYSRVTEANSIPSAPPLRLLALQKITMGLLSLLPESLQTVETWIIRIFVGHAASPPAHPLPSLTTTQFLLAAITFGPWLALLVYDIILYIWRSATFDLPQIGGRARGQRQRPRAPSLKERPDGHKRRFSLAAVLPPVDFHQVDGPAVTTPTSSASGHKRNITATMSRPIFEFVDDDE
jgi:hypothetical protein